MPSLIEAPAIPVVEDETFTRLAAVDLLSEAGLANYEAADADEALSTLAEHPEIGLIVTDVNMPGTMDGMSLARRVCRIRPDVGIIVTSGRRRIPDAELPGDGTFLPKPYRPEQLIDAVERKLRQLH
jgi:DNA-binding NtrC family response regulator